MKILSLIALGTLLSTTAYAQYQGPTNKLYKEATVQEALKADDDTKLLLTGKIVKHLAKDDYVFEDNSGSATVEIDSDKFINMIIDENTKVKLYVEVENDFLEDVEIEADKIEIIK